MTTEIYGVRKSTCLHPKPALHPKPPNSLSQDLLGRIQRGLMDSRTGPVQTKSVLHSPRSAPR